MVGPSIHFCIAVRNGFHGNCSCRVSDESMQHFNDDEDVAGPFPTRNLFQPKHLDSPAFTPPVIVGSHEISSVMQIGNIEFDNYGGLSSAARSTSQVRDDEEMMKSLNFFVKDYFMQVNARMNGLLSELLISLLVAIDSSGQPGILSVTKSH
uniref:Uncharacterized protein n=1 Tax=Physcomitrium patens TaxID=3218 RepID=A0A2K1JKL8_PHYPA|nr:hypothetical protein PHYPA_016914 [Physcomitrium patens]